MATLFTQKRFLQSGYSVVEIIIVIAIMALIAGFVFSTFVNIKSTQALDKDTETVVETLRQARSQTLSSQNSSQYGVHFGTSKITLFTGTTYSASDTTNQDFSLSGGDTVLSISLFGAGSDVVFTRLSGETSQYGTVTLTSPSSSQAKTVTIYKTGLVEYN